MFSTFKTKFVNVQYQAELFEISSIVLDTCSVYGKIYSCRKTSNEIQGLPKLLQRYVHRIQQSPSSPQEKHRYGSVGCVFYKSIMVTEWIYEMYKTFMTSHNAQIYRELSVLEKHNY